jgi:mannose-6-phosphate isomerase-like protein (cupin superfamily)
METSIRMDVHKLTLPDEKYALAVAPDLVLKSVRNARVGLCRWGAGTRSPDEGLRASAASEIAYVLKGKLRVETSSETFEVTQGQVAITNPAEPHCVTALADSEVFFVLLDPV